MSKTRGWSFSSVMLALAIASAAASAFGAAIVQELKGDVRAGATVAQSKSVAPTRGKLPERTAPKDRIPAVRANLDYP